MGMQGGKAVRLLSGTGASFALLPIPSVMLRQGDAAYSVDIELLTPDRLVRYLDRPLGRDMVQQLWEAWMRAGEEAVPELTVKTVQDDGAGLSVLVSGSTPLTVTVEVTVITDIDAEVHDYDVVAFDVARTSLVDAAHAVAEWLS